MHFVFFFVFAFWYRKIIELALQRTYKEMRADLFRSVQKVNRVASATICVLHEVCWLNNAQQMNSRMCTPAPGRMKSERIGRHLNFDYFVRFAVISPAHRASKWNSLELPVKHHIVYPKSCVIIHTTDDVRFICLNYREKKNVQICN